MDWWWRRREEREAGAKKEGTKSYTHSGGAAPHGTRATTATEKKGEAPDSPQKMEMNETRGATDGRMNQG